MRKDCGTRRDSTGRRVGQAIVRVVIVGFVSCSVTETVVRAGSVRMWPTAVVVSDAIHLDDVCVLRGIDPETEARIARLPIAEAPPVGGSRVVHLELIRSALAAQGVNLGDITFGGAVRCEVQRPALTGRNDASGSEGPARTGSGSGAAGVRARRGETRSVSGTDRSTDRDAASSVTLRRAVIEYFNAQLAPFHGTAEVAFDRTDDQVLDLSGPAYTFRVRARDRNPIGMAAVEVDVLAKERLVQTVSMIVQVSMLRPTVVARRAINQGAMIQAADVETVPLRYTRLKRLGMDDAARVVGQRARRLIRAGTTIDPDMLEQVPLVLRGQLVSLVSVVGGVRVVTSGKAAEDGMLGDVVTVRTTDNRKVELEAVVVGPGRVQVGGRRPTFVRDRVALKEDKP